MGREERPQCRIVDGHCHVGRRECHQRLAGFGTKAGHAEQADGRESGGPHQPWPLLTPARPAPREHAGVVEASADEERGHRDGEKRVTALAEVVGERVEGVEKRKHHEGEDGQLATRCPAGDHGGRRDHKPARAGPGQDLAEVPANPGERAFDPHPHRYRSLGDEELPESIRETAHQVRAVARHVQVQPVVRGAEHQSREPSYDPAGGDRKEPPAESPDRGHAPERDREEQLERHRT